MAPGIASVSNPIRGVTTNTYANASDRTPVGSRLNHYFASPGLGSPGTQFVLPGPVDFGALGRGLAIRAPGQKSVDLMLSKRMAAWEGLNLEFRAEAFNLLNWVNFGVPDSNVGDPGFGVISSTTTSPRVLQLAWKVSF
jgi:hypothetical protein